MASSAGDRGGCAARGWESLMLRVPRFCAGDRASCTAGIWAAPAEPLLLPQATGGAHVAPSSIPSPWKGAGGWSPRRTCLATALPAEALEMLPPVLGKGGLCTSQVFERLQVRSSLFPAPSLHLLGEAAS